MEITQCLHVALLVSDLDRAEQFYGEILGLRKVERSLKFPGVWYQIGSFQIHLMVATDYHPPLINAQKWGRNHHVAFSVVDFEAVKEILLTHGYPVQMSASGRRALFTQDPDGNIIELNSNS